MGGEEKWCKLPPIFQIMRQDKQANQFFHIIIISQVPYC